MLNSKLFSRCALPFILLALPPVCAHADDTLSFSTYRSGSSEDASTETSGGYLLAGGGEDQEDAMQWLLDRGGRGDVVILRASGSDGYNQWLMDKGAHSVESIVFHKRSAAFSKYVISRVQSAEVIFFAGGDQSLYVNFWKGTPLAELINQKAKAGTPIGGTSAGLAILGEFVYSAQNESAQSPDVLTNPFHDDVTLENNFLRFEPFKGLITDSHFSSRKRLGRLAAFLARIDKEGWIPFPHGVGIDDETGLGVLPSGDTILFGKGSAYFLSPTKAPDVCEPGRPLTYKEISIFKMNKDSIFNVSSFLGANGVESRLSIEDGKIQNLFHQ